MKQTLPMGLAEIREAIVASGINGNTDMGDAALAKDRRALVAAMVTAGGDRPLPPRNRGRWSGLRTYDFQNSLFHANELRGWGFTDRTLGLVWATELPSNKCDFLAHMDYVASTRTAYLRGRHGSNVIAPDTREAAVHKAPKAKRERRVKVGGEQPVAAAAETTE